MRIIEQKIVKLMKNLPMNDFKTHWLSERDKVFRVDNVVYYKLHGTVVAKRHDDGRLQFYTQGWTTNTTKSRINAILDGFNIPIGLSQEKFIWYWWWQREDKPRREFEEYDIVKKSSDGKVEVTYGYWNTFLSVKGRDD